MNITYRVGDYLFLNPETAAVLVLRRSACRSVGDCANNNNTTGESSPACDKSCRCSDEDANKESPESVFVEKELLL